MGRANVKQIIVSVLKDDPRIWDDNQTELNQTKLLDLIDGIDENIITLLLANEAIRERFFVKIKDVYVFKTNDFKFFMEEHKIDNSYTQYKNRIGLTDGKNFIKESNDVVLDFPYKDCILAGDQTTEEGLDSYFEYEAKKTRMLNGEKIIEPAGFKEKQAKRKEVFFNQTLAKDEIDRLLDDKAFVNWQRFTSAGEEDIKELKRATDGTIKENLIIKGNNLLALHSLKRQFASKIKLIYIDPPYNTGSDSFKYNDKFNHSTWLTFMKNRLEVARDLLSEDGVIFVQCDDNEQAYLKIIMDEVFNAESYINTISIKMKNVAGASGGGEDKKLKKNIEYLHIYVNNYLSFSSFTGVYNYTPIGELVEQYREKKISWKYTTALIYAGDKEYIGSTVDGSGAEIKIFSRKHAIIKSIAQIIKEENISENEAYNKYAKSIFQTAMPQSSIRPRVMDKVSKLKVDGDFYSIEYMPKSGKNKDVIYEQFYKGKNFRLLAWLRDVTEEKDGILYKKDMQGTFWDFVGETKNLTKEGSVELLSGKKPEKLLQRIIEMTTKENDIILDFHLGSGTTAAVVHKMGRQYIGIEQLDYGNNDSVVRLQNVINGDNTGISKSINWQGGGEFIYCELAKWNEVAKEKINECSDLSELKLLFCELYEKYFLNYNVKVKEFKDKIINEANFKALPLIEQKRMFLVMLDLNQMYVQKTEMADRQFGISDKDQQFTAEFYNEEL